MSIFNDLLNKQQNKYQISQNLKYLFITRSSSLTTKKNHINRVLNENEEKQKIVKIVNAEFMQKCLKHFINFTILKNNVYYNEQV